MYLVTLTNKQECIILLSSTRSVLNFESVTSSAIILPGERERERDARRLSVCGGRRVWRILIKAQGNRGRLKRIVMLCPCECLCTSEPLCTQFVHVLPHREKLCGCPSVSMPGFLCICVCLFTFMHLCFHMFLHMSTLHFLCV